MSNAARDKDFEVHTSMTSLRAPMRLLDADIVEIRVSLTPLRYFDNPEHQAERTLRVVGDTCYSSVSLDRHMRVSAKDTRVIFYLIRELVLSLVRTYLEVEL